MSGVHAADSVDRMAVGGVRRWAAQTIFMSAATGCLSPPPIVDTTGTSEAPGTSSGGAESTSSGGDPIMTSTVGSSSAGEPPPGCDDGDKNQGESDVDCGGPCEACPAGQACVDNKDCATMACLKGVCVVPACLSDDACAGLDAVCALGTCDLQSFTCAAAPAHEGEACDDGSLCSSSSSCQAGACAPDELVDCSDFDSPCTQGQCDPETGACLAVDLADGSECDDGDSCTLLSTCEAGSCTTTEAGAQFFEDFSAPAPGWELDKLWAIGAAKASPAAPSGADPGDDHSPGDDGMLAGTEIGGLHSDGAHESVCISSPPIDTSKIVGSLWVSFWRHLHAPPLPLVIHRVDVWNGATWKNLENGYNQTTNDAAWSFVKLNASGSQAKDFRVRVCVERLPGAPDFAGWSIDDVTVAPVPCTP